MLSILFLIAAWTFVLVVLLASASAVGWLLHWLIPDISLGEATLIGLVANCIAIFLIVKLTSAAEKLRNSRNEFDEEDEEEEEEDPKDIPIEALFANVAKKWRNPPTRRKSR